ncbi:hypothetical protein ACMX1A_06110, partial [Bartonella bacilliformis]
METQIILKAGDSVAGVIALHDTCPLSKIRQISTAFYAMRMTKPPFLWARGKKPSLSEAKKIISLGHKALTILDEKAAKEDLSAMFRLLSGVLKHQSTADAKATATAYLLSLNGVSHWALKTATRDIMKRKAEG